MTIAEINQNPPETETNKIPPPLPEKSKKKIKQTGLSIPLTIRPRLRKPRKQSMAGYMEMKAIPGPKKPPRLQPIPETAQSLEPLLDE